MIAIKPIHGRLGNIAYTIKEGEIIKSAFMKVLDIEALKKAGAIKDEKTAYEKPVEMKPVKVKQDKKD